MAAAEGISISLAEVNATADTIRTLNNSLKTDLENIKTEINNLADSWQDDGSASIRAKINAKQTVFDDYQKVIESYAKFLETTVESYQQTQQNINSKANANSFQ